MKKWVVMAVSFTVGFVAAFASSPTCLAQGFMGHRVRKVYLRHDDVAIVRTALGIATIIQVPDRPTSVVLGDTSAFKVEYLDSAITIKPLRGSARSNLYIYTDYRRYNVTLVTVASSSADYIVYLDSEIDQPKASRPIREHWRTFHRAKIWRGLKIETERIGVAGNLLMVSFSTSSKHVRNFSPASIWLTQKGKTVPIESLSLTGVDVGPSQPISGLLTVERSDIPFATAPLALEIRSPFRMSLLLPEARLWMK